MPGTIQQLFRYPVKGMRGVPIPHLKITTKAGVVGDRRRAFAKKPDTAGWNPKGYYYVGMNTPVMVSINPSIYVGNRLQQEVQALTGHEVFPVEAGCDYNLTDTNPLHHGPTVSLLNLATVRAFGNWLGRKVDPQRFRMNMLVEGLEPFEELEWVTPFPEKRKLIVGRHTFEVFDACERCRAIEANPQTGQRDMEIAALRDFMAEMMPNYTSPQRKNNMVMGVLLKPLSTSLVYWGDGIRLIDK